MKYTQPREEWHTDLQTNIKIVGDTNHVLLLQRIVGEALHSLMMQEGHHQLLLPLYLHCRCESALSCTHISFTT